MEVKVNGQWQQGAWGTLRELLGGQKDLPVYYVVAVNQVCVPQKDYASTPLKPGDEVEILSPMQGG